MEGFALKMLEAGERRPLRSWKSCRHYEALVQKGLAVELEDSNLHFRRFAITEAGRAELARAA